MSQQPTQLFNKYTTVLGVILASIIGILSVSNEFTKMYPNIEASRVVETISFLIILSFLFFMTKMVPYNRRWIGMALFGLVGVAWTVTISWWIWGDNRFISSPLVYPIEKIGVNSAGYGRGDLTQTVRFLPKDIENKFRLDYTIKDTDPNYAGIVLKLFRPVDVTSYRAIQFEIKLSDDQCGLQLWLTDNYGGKSPVLLSNHLKYQPTEQTIQVPLSAFDLAKVDLTALRKIDFSTDYSLAKDSHYVIVSKVEFVR
jgi:hypothetical protein